MDSNDKWFTIGMIGICFAIMMPTIFSDKESDRIAACVSGENMEYVDGDCRPIQSD